MNANKLADKLIEFETLFSLLTESIPQTKGMLKDDNFLRDSATMLRQQQAEIEALKKKIVSLEFLARKEK